MFDRFTDDARSAMGRTRLEAVRANNDEIETLHMLLALLREPTPSVVAFLEKLGVSASTLVGTFEGEVVPGQAQVSSDIRMPFAPSAKHALEAAMSIAGRLGHRSIDEYIRGPERAAVRATMLTDFDLPHLRVTTDDGYVPEFAAIVEWTIDQRRR